MPINEYLKNVKKRFSSGISTEHSYRADLQNLLNNLVSGITVTNEPKRQKCGAPDYIIQKKSIPIGYIEAKDIGIDLNHIEKSGQLKRYLKSLDNLILTDYIEFRFYRYGEKVNSIKLAEIENNNKLNFIEDNFDLFITSIKSFCTFVGQTIKSSKRLAEMMAQKAKIMKDVIYKTLTDDDENNSLKEQLKAFRKILITDLKEITFSDIYAQTIAYGLFVARLHDKTLEDFSRQEALFLVPKSNPFLRQLFSYVAGPELDDRVVWIVNDLADVFRATDVKEIMSDFGKTTQQNDSFLHFYETFLGEYDSSLRKSKGVYYTPEPVVNFIIRAVDDILKKDFKINDGLADISKTEITIQDSGRKFKDKVHKVQILDPAAGTGTFLAEVVKEISKKFETQKGMWSRYVENDLIPRLNGFEILMAPYTMCHLKLDMLLRETGYKPKDENNQQRLRVFLTNSLEDAHPETGTLFASQLANEANEANLVKKETPVMIILGNPPYSVSSMNKSDWIQNLLSDYKKDLNEKNIQPLSDDYIKFIRFGQHFIDKNGEGILAFISNNSFIDGIIHKQMRKHLLESFDNIYILNLHGNSRINEISPDGSVDQNVFDIMQGVSINIFIKTTKYKNKKLGNVFYFDLFGKRDLKYENLNDNSFKNIKWEKLNTVKPDYFFVKKNFESKIQYDTYIDLKSIFIINSIGIVTGNDDEYVALNKKTILEKFLNADSFAYRPLDNRFTIFDNKILQRARYKVMRNYINENLGLNIGRQSKLKGTECLVSSNISCKHYVTGETYNFPLYIYSEESEQQNIFSEETKTHNFNEKILNEFEKILKLKFILENNDKNQFSALDIFDYIYAVLHSSKYREKYSEFLKIDFPRIPYPKNSKSFFELVKFGAELRKYHLFEHSNLSKYITEYPIDGDNIISHSIVKKDFEIIDNKKMLGRVWINDTQYFDKIPAIAWEFFIGGYQPAQKYLKDRKNSKLSFDEIIHYQKIIVALYETHKTMIEIDKIIKI